MVEDIEPVGLRRQRKAHELEIARQIVHLPRPERVRVWQEQAGTSESSLYRRLAELGRIDALDLDV